jgi:hypothetical protein
MEISGNQKNILKPEINVKQPDFVYSGCCLRVCYLFRAKAIDGFRMERATGP